MDCRAGCAVVSGPSGRGQAGGHGRQVRHTAAHRCCRPGRAARHAGPRRVVWGERGGLPQRLARLYLYRVLLWFGGGMAAVGVVVGACVFFFIKQKIVLLILI